MDGRDQGSRGMQEERRRQSVRGMRSRRRKRRLAGICMTAVLFAAIFGLIKLVYQKELSGAAMNQEIYPESLIALSERNPETRQFVLDYPKNKNRQMEIDLTGEVTKGSIPLFLQWDERWGYETYGNDFLAVTGCGPTCLSMVRCGLRGDTQWDPLTVARWAEEGGFYVDGAGSSWDLMSEGAENLGLIQEDVVFDAKHILDTLESGSPIICAMRPGDFTTSGHFIVLSGVNEEGQIVVCDPNSRKNSEKAWDVEELIPQIKNLWSYR